MVLLEHRIKSGSGSEYMIIENGQVVFDNGKWFFLNDDTVDNIYTKTPSICWVFACVRPAWALTRG
jgi:hypothetical protein